MTISTIINVGLTSESSTVQTSGDIQRLVTNADRTAFFIDDDHLTSLIYAYNGSVTLDLYVRDPTEWGNKYQEYGWQEVQTILVVDNYKILESTSQTEIVKTSEFRNISSVPAEFDTSISTEVSNQSEHSWSNSNALDFEQMFKYDIGFLGTGTGGETTFSYEHSWGETKTESKTVTLGSTTGVKVTLQPGEGVDVFLTADRGTLTVRIEYKAYVRGIVFANYPSEFQGHHFYGYDVASLLNTVSVPNIQKFTEDIKIGFYANDRIVVKDPEGNIVLNYYMNEVTGE